MADSTTVKEMPACPVETTLTLIGDKWKVLILRDLLPGTKRFGELKKSIGHVTQKVLTAQLREMEAAGLLTRTVYAEVPPRVEYTLTSLGYSLKPILDAMWDWGEAYKLKTSPPLDPYTAPSSPALPQLGAETEGNRSAIDVRTPFSTVPRPVMPDSRVVCARPPAPI